MQNLPVKKLRILARQKHETRRNLARLPDAADLRLLAELLHFLSRPRRRLQRRVHGSWCHSIDADALGQKVLGERAREGDDGALCRGVIDHAGRAAERYGRGGVDDATHW